MLFLLAGQTSRSLSSSESLAVTTYYSAPSASYRQLTVTGYTYLARDGGAVGVATGGGTIQATQDGRTVRLDVRGNVMVDDVYLSNPAYGSPRWASSGVDWNRLYRVRNPSSGYVSDGSSTGGQGSGVEAYCNSGDILISGGCESLDVTSGNDSAGFILKPDYGGNGFFCAEDGVPIGRNNNTAAYAVCYRH